MRRDYGVEDPADRCFWCLRRHASQTWYQTEGRKFPVGTVRRICDAHDPEFVRGTLGNEGFRRLTPEESEVARVMEE